MKSTFDSAYKQKCKRFLHKITFVVLSRYVILEQSKSFVIQSQVRYSTSFTLDEKLNITFFNDAFRISCFLLLLF